MKVRHISLPGLILGAVAGISAVVLIPQPGWTQTDQQANPLEDLHGENNTDPFSRRNDNPFSVFELMHRAQMGGNRNPDELATEQNQGIDAAAAAFRARQLKLMQQNQQQPPANSPSTMPSVAK